MSFVHIIYAFILANVDECLCVCFFNFCMPYNNNNNRNENLFYYHNHKKNVCMCVCVCCMWEFHLWCGERAIEMKLVSVCFFHLVERAYSFLVCRNPDGNARNFGSHKLCIYICVGIMPSINHTMEMCYSCASSHWLLYNRERNSKFSEKSCLFWWLLSIAVERRWLTENSTGKH